MSGPLDGTLVLDLSRVLAGPWASQSLSGRAVVTTPGAGDRPTWKLQAAGKVLISFQQTAAKNQSRLISRTRVVNPF